MRTAEIAALLDRPQHVITISNDMTPLRTLIMENALHM